MATPNWNKILDEKLANWDQIRRRQNGPVDVYLKGSNWLPKSFEVYGKFMLFSFKEIRNSLDVIERHAWEIGANAAVEVEFKDREVNGNLLRVITGTAIWYERE